MSFTESCCADLILSFSSISFVEQVTKWMNYLIIMLTLMIQIHIDGNVMDFVVVVAEWT